MNPLAALGWAKLAEMSKSWHFGTIVTSDYWDGRLMVLGPAGDKPKRWLAMVLTDGTSIRVAGDTLWEQGDIISLSPTNQGLRIVASPEETE